MSYSACSHFRPNFWRPTNCAYCYRPKHKHFDKAEAQFMIPRAATISTDSPTVCRERKLCSEPPVEKIDEINTEDSSPSRLLDDIHKQVGIVKPYAVVELNSISWQHDQFLYGNKTFPAHLPLPPSSLRQRVGSCTNLMLGNCYHSNSQPNVVQQFPKRNIIPKRKAPPPPSGNNRSNRSNSVPNIIACNVGRNKQPVDDSCSTETSIDITKEKSPPNKPPRTQSTFVTFDNNNPVKTSSGNDYEPLRRLDNTTAVSNCTQSFSILQQIQDIFNNALISIAKRYFEDMTVTEQFKLMDWSDITVCIDMNDQHQLYYHMQPISLEPFEESMHLHQLEIAKSVAPHLNLSLLRGTLMQTPVDYIDFLPNVNQFIVYDSSSVKVPLEKILPTWRSSLTDERYMHHILLVLVQVLRGLKHLYYNGIVHRDVGLESLVAWTHGNECIIKLDNFQYALYRKGPISATTFVFAYHELSWLGGVESHLPPEILDTPNNVNTLDYSHTDSFAVGCLIYELIVGVSPFDKDTQLVYQQYTKKDLPGFPKHSRLLGYLEQLAHLLLFRDPLKRLGVSDALLAVQTLLWLPHSWLEQCIPVDDIEDHLTYIKATLLAELAQNDNHTPIPLETLLKIDFMSSCNSSDLIRTLSVFKKTAIV